MEKIELSPYKRKTYGIIQEIILDKTVLTSGGNLLGDVNEIIENNMYINPAIHIDIRKYQLSKEKTIILPSDGIIAIKDIILYELPELDPKSVHKNHDEQAFIDLHFS